MTGRAKASRTDGAVRRVVELAGPPLVAVGIGMAISRSPSSAMLLIGVMAAAAVFFVIPEALVAIVLLAFATTTLINEFTVAVGPASVYPLDLLVLLVAGRAALLGLDRGGARVWSAAVTVLLAVSVGLYAIAAFRGHSAGTPIDETIRRSLAPIYFPLLLLSLIRLVDQPGVSPRRLLKYVGYVGLFLIAWALTMRGLGRPFESADDPALGAVPVASGADVRRDYGSAAAFIVYPAVALCGVAGMAYAARWSWRWAGLASLGILATLLTLVRGEIFALTASIAVILLLRVRGASMRRVRTAATLLAGVAVALTLLIAFNPALGGAILERSLPGVREQSEGADVNRQYRIDAVMVGVDAANAQLGGIGVAGEAQLLERGIDPGFLPHSGVGMLLLYGGWPLLICSAATVLLAIRQSFSLPSSPQWVHPAFVGVMTMLAVYTVSAGGLGGDAWVIGLAAVAVAVRSSAALPAAPELEGSASRLPVASRTRTAVP